MELQITKHGTNLHDDGDWMVNLFLVQKNGKAWVAKLVVEEDGSIEKDFLEPDQKSLDRKLRGTKDYFLGAPGVFMARTVVSGYLETRVFAVTPFGVELLDYDGRMTDDLRRQIIRFYGLEPKFETKAVERDVLEETHDLPLLEGTEKQVAWANDLRADFLKNDSHFPCSRLWVAKRVKSAKHWIDCRVSQDRLIWAAFGDSTWAAVGYKSFWQDMATFRKTKHLVLTDKQMDSLVGLDFRTSKDCDKLDALVESLVEKNED